MRRRCDGTDPNLVMHVHEDGERCPIPQCPQRTKPVPCNCGLSFDDVRHMVIWPHAPV